MITTPITTFVAVVLGILTWTLLEYVFHRFLGHSKGANKNPFGAEHTAHHSRGNYFAPSWKKALAAVVFTALVLPLASLIAGLELGIAYTAGLIGFYVTYEALHRMMHVYEGFGPFGRWARRHHFFHHFHDPKKNHGVTSPLWDIVFGTYQPVRSKVEVPAKLAMQWLTDPTTGEVKRHLSNSFALRGAAKKLTHSPA
jgi:sterol desaturase/sphingolipid hydroxylase (fatty acid hydroxylase superfamily)